MCGLSHSVYKAVITAPGTLVADHHELIDVAINEHTAIPVHYCQLYRRVVGDVVADNKPHVLKFLDNKRCSAQDVKHERASQSHRCLHFIFGGGRHARCRSTYAPLTLSNLLLVMISAWRGHRAVEQAVKSRLHRELVCGKLRYDHSSKLPELARQRNTGLDVVPCWCYI